MSGHVDPGHPGGPGVGHQQGGQDANGGGLAGPVGAEKAEDGAGDHVEVEPVEGSHLAVVLDQAGGLDHMLHWTLLGWTRSRRS